MQIFTKLFTMLVRAVNQLSTTCTVIVISLEVSRYFIAPLILVLEFTLRWCYSRRDLGHPEWYTRPFFRRLLIWSLPCRFLCLLNNKVQQLHQNCYFCHILNRAAWGWLTGRSSRSHHLNSSIGSN